MPAPGIIISRIRALEGVIAKPIMPGKDPGGIIVTAPIGMAGSLLGIFAGSLLRDERGLWIRVDRFHPGCNHPAFDLPHGEGGKAGRLI